MENALPELSPSLILLPPSPLLSTTHCRKALLYALAEKPFYQETVLSDQFNHAQKYPYKSFLASKILSELTIWELYEPQTSKWYGALFPTRNIAVVLPVIHPRSSYYKLLSEGKLPLTENRIQHEQRLIARQMEYLRSQTSPIRAFLKLPIIHVYIQEIEEVVPLEHLIGNDLFAVTQTLISKIGEPDSFTNELKVLLQSLQ